MAMFNDHVDAVFCDHSRVDVLCSKEQRIFKMPALSGDFLPYFVRETGTVVAPIHRRSDLMAIGGFDENLDCCQEYDLHIRLALRRWRRIEHVSEPLCRVRRVPGSVSSNEKYVFATMSRLLQSLCAQLASDESTTPERLEAIASVLYLCGRHLVREGEVGEAERAFRCSKQIAPNTLLPVSLAMKILTNLVGPVTAERFRSVARRILLG